MLRKMLAALLCLALMLSLFGCTQTPSQTEPPETTTEPTVPPTTVPTASDLYAEARKAVEEAENLELTITMEEARTIGGQTYRRTMTQNIAFQGIGTDSFTATATDTSAINGTEYISTEYYDGTTVYSDFDGLPFRSEMTVEEYLDRFLPAVLLDETLYGSITAQGNTYSFTEPTAGEAWIVASIAELHSASGTAVMTDSGALSSTAYSADFTFGPTHVETNIQVEISTPASLTLTSPLTFEDTEYVTLDYIDAPWLICQALCDIQASENISYSASDTMITYAGGGIFSQQESIDIYGTGRDTMSNYELDISLQNFQQTLDEYSRTENLQGSACTVTENDETSSHPLSGSSVISVRENYMESILYYIWTPEVLSGAKLTDLGGMFLLELEGSEELARSYCCDAVATFWNDGNYLDDMASDYKTEKINAYLSIDKVTQLPVAFGFDYEGVHTIDGMELPLTDQWNQTMFLSSNTAYEAITEEPLPDVEPETKATPLFYHVTGENGQEMWLFGTIHVGDDRTAFLPQEIFDALENSNALAVEFDVDAFDEAVEADSELRDQLMEAYFYADGSETKDHLEEETYETAVKLLKATGNYYMNAEYLKPYLWSQSIDNFYLQQGYDLVSEKGVDNRLMAFAREKNIEIRDIESGLFQTQMITGFSDALQELILKESLETNTVSYCMATSELYELWCSGDEAALREELSDEADTSELTEEELAEYEAQLPLMEEYDKAMSHDRNAGMLAVAIEYLESGETVFYAVGLAHLLNDTNGLVDALREAGYTVELVTFQ